MAKARRIPADFDIELTLSQEEAQVLVDLHWMVSGCMEGARGRFQTIAEAIQNQAGIKRKRSYSTGDNKLDLDQFTEIGF